MAELGESNESCELVCRVTWLMGCNGLLSYRGLSECEGGMELRIGEGLRLTYSWMTWSDHVSINLKEYFTRAMSMRYTRLASGDVIVLRSDGLI
jgi:hypothetical protein